MLKQALGTAVAAVFATAIAGAQTPAQSQDEQRGYQAGQQTVTVEGCLQQDRTASAQVADATRDDEKRFMLVNAEVQQGAMASGAATDRPAGTQIGATGQADTQAETPVGTSGAAATSAAKFKVSGLDEERLEQYAGQRVRIEGRIESGAQQHGMTGAERRDDHRTDADRPTADQSTPDTPSAVGTTGTPETGAATHDHSRAAAGDVKELKATSITAIAGSCPESPASR